MKEKKEKFYLFKKNRKGAFAETTVIFIAGCLIALVMIGFYIFVDFSKGGYTVEDSESLVGDNLFLSGLLRSQMTYEGKTVSLSEVVARYCQKNDESLEKAIKGKISPMMLQMFGKDICWRMTLPNSQAITTDAQDCSLLSKDEDITAEILLPGFGEEIYNVRFETKK